MRAAAVLALVGGVLASAPARAAEPWLLSAEGSVAQPLSEPQRTLFKTGVSGSLALHRSLAPWLSVGVRLRYGYLLDGGAPADPGRVDPGAASLMTGSLALRVRPLAGLSPADPSRGTGLWVEVAGGGGLTGELWRGAMEVGAGWGFEAGSVDVGPAVRYVQVVQPSGNLDGRDARILLAGLEVTFFDPRPEPPADPEPPSDPEPSDRDGDGLVDEVDECPDRPEDADGFEDADGCPDPDNDGDGILDTDDGCPLEPEDADGFEDADGCPDPDNDGDGILDGPDECPNQAEVVNGNDDEDGCPDEGLIELIDDRIVLEERVLFDRERSRVKRSAVPVIDAIVRLWSQHPEWALLRVEGHADVRGPEDYNLDLSTRRARNVMKVLIDRGIPEEIIGYEGLGESRPRDPRYTDEAHERNRRVEFVVVARKPPELIEQGDVDLSGRIRFEKDDRGEGGRE